MIFECKNCQKEFTSSASNNRVNCSLVCRNEVNAIKMLGNTRGFIKGVSSWNKGKPAPWAKNNRSNLPLIPWNKGKEFMKDEKHPLWKGDKVGYQPLHQWITKKLGRPNLCEICKNTKLKHRQYHWASKGHKYTRKLTDWLRLCAKCHKAYDRGLVSV